MGSTMGDLTRILSDDGHNGDIPLVWNAYEVAKRVHGGQRRRNGEPYIRHPVEVATIVARHGGTVPAVCAALLHDVIEDAAVPSSHLHTEFGSEIATMVEDMTTRVIRTHQAASNDLTLLTVADRLHNLRTLRRVSAPSRQRTSLDTLVFHVPLARRLNAPAVAAELTDLACAALGGLDHPDARERRQRAVSAIRRADPRAAAEVVAAFGGGAAIVGSGAVPEWAVATGGAGVLTLVAAALFGRDPKAAKRLADLLQAWRRN
jgi:GTP pyrophosphokinase